MTTSTATTLANVVASPPSGRPKAVVFDHHAYAASVLLRGRPVPWDNATAYAAFFAQAQGLLRPDVALLDLNRLYGHLTAGKTGLETAMAARSRTGFALRTLLGDDDINRAVLDFVTVFAKTARQPVVLRFPSPMAWLIGTHRFSGADDTSGLDADNAENASMYVSDWLRAFAGLPIAGLLLDNRTPARRPAQRARSAGGLHSDCQSGRQLPLDAGAARRRPGAPARGRCGGRLHSCSVLAGGRAWNSPPGTSTWPRSPAPLHRRAYWPGWKPWANFPPATWTGAGAGVWPP